MRAPACITLAVALGCHGAPAGEAADAGACVGAKCDDPNAAGTSEGSSAGESSSDGDADPDPAVEPMCYDRRTEAFNPNRLSYTPTALRWSCSDIDSTSPDDRGQEYCEYFAIAALPPTPGHPDAPPAILGRALGADPADGHTPFALDLDGEQIAALEGASDSVVGACVFSSWNADIDAPCGDACEVDDVLGVAVDTATFRMKYDPNTNEAALALVDDCTGYLPPGDAGNPDDPFADPFLRACQLNTIVNETQYRKSDNVICGASVRLAECGCRPADGSDLGPAIAPPGDLGFRLGGWQGPAELPPGCRYHDVVAGAHTLVVCDLTGAEVLQNADELKGYCRERFADDVVVHVAIEPDAIVCEPDPAAAYAGDCGAQPWVLAP